MSQSEAGYQSPSGTAQPSSEAQQLLQSFWQRATDDIKLLGAVSVSHLFFHKEFLKPITYFGSRSRPSHCFP